MSVRIYETKPNKDGYIRNNGAFVNYTNTFCYVWHVVNPIISEDFDYASFFSFDTSSLINANIYDAELWVYLSNRSASCEGGIYYRVASDTLNNPLSGTNYAAIIDNGTVFNIFDADSVSAGSWVRVKVPHNLINSGGWTDFGLYSGLDDNHYWLLETLEGTNSPYLVIFDSEGKKIVEDEITNIIQSVFYYLSGTEYIKQNQGTSGTMRDYFPNLDFRPAYPENLKSRDQLPIIAIEYIGRSNSPIETYGSEKKERPHAFRAYGFAGQYTDDGRNKFEQKQLGNDLYRLLEDTVLPYYSFSGSGFTEERLLEVTNVSLDFEPSTDVNYAERYRFTMDFDVSD